LGRGQIERRTSTGGRAASEREKRKAADQGATLEVKEVS